MSFSEAATMSEQARFQALLDAHERIVFKVVGGFAWNADDQHDLAQEIRYQLWRAFCGYDAKRTFSTWMYRVALNTAISWSRQTKARRQGVTPIEELPEIPASVPGEQPAQALYSLIDSLDELNRALMLLVVDGHSHAEIGEILGISPGNVATKISRLKARLRLEATETQP